MRSRPRKKKTSPLVLLLILALSVTAAYFGYTNKEQLNLHWENTIARFTLIAPFVDYQIVDDFQDSSINPSKWSLLSECYCPGTQLTNSLECKTHEECGIDKPVYQTDTDGCTIWGNPLLVDTGNDGYRWDTSTGTPLCNVRGQCTFSWDGNTFNRDFCNTDGQCTFMNQRTNDRGLNYRIKMWDIYLPQSSLCGGKSHDVITGTCGIYRASDGTTQACFNNQPMVAEASGELTLHPGSANIWPTNYGGYNTYSSPGLGYTLKEDLKNKEVMVYGKIDNQNHNCYNTQPCYEENENFNIQFGNCNYEFPDMNGEFVLLWKPSTLTPGEYALYNGAGVELCHTTDYHTPVTFKVMVPSVGTVSLGGWNEISAYSNSFLTLYQIREKTPLACKHSTTDSLTVQAFTGPTTISVANLRFPAGNGLASFCLDNPVFRIKPTESGPDREVTLELSYGHTVQIPEGETWLVFYYFDNSAALAPTICNFGKVYNLQTQTCQDYSTVIFACGNGGVWDEIHLTCSYSVPVDPGCLVATDKNACCATEHPCGTGQTASWNTDYNICTCQNQTIIVPQPEPVIPPTCSNNGVAFNYTWTENSVDLWKWMCKSTRTSNCNPWEELLNGYCSWNVDSSPYCVQGSLTIHANGSIECIYTPPITGGGGGGADFYTKPVCTPPMTWDQTLKRCAGPTTQVIIETPKPVISTTTILTWASGLSLIEWTGIAIALILTGMIIKEITNKKRKK